MSVLSSGWEASGEKGPGPVLSTHAAIGQTCSRKTIPTVAARPGLASPLVVIDADVYMCE